MYRILVFFSDAKRPTLTMMIKLSTDVTRALPGIIADHEGCERVEVNRDGMRLFSMDCAGKTTPG